MPTKHRCPSCKGLLWLESGLAARCPHCGKTVKAGKARKPAISSMRAATRSGYTFVGGRIGSASRPSSREYKPNVIMPRPEVRQAREAFQEALKEKRTFWQNEIEQWAGEFDIPEPLAEFLSGLGIE